MVSDSVVIIAAHAFEARVAARVGQGVGKEPWGRWMLYRGEVWDQPLMVIRCGPGKVAAAAAAQAAVQYLDPAMMISFGAAGSPDPTVAPGQVTVAESVVDVALFEMRDLPVSIAYRFSPHPVLQQKLLEVPGISLVTVLCWEGQVVTPEHQPALAEILGGAVVVDGESAAVAQVAAMWDVPWAAVKVVSDHGEVERLRYLAVVARRPLEWAAEVVRRACYRFARERVTTQEIEPVEETSL
jgi:adenosylhomocysteine nucleosidase